MSGAAESPLSENCIVRIAASLPGSEERVRRLFEQSLQPIETLLKELDAHLEGIRVSARHIEFIDVESAARVARFCARLLEEVARAPSRERHRLAQVAIRYFAERDDVERDLESPIGFDDDLRIVQAIARELGMKDLADA